eukprot:TRINITY_DN18342_c0_g1_i1.p1 TRINITY_DN18342_c0_g1~~TRINITY_DN18342_c0_g1_i1.p1  ORF type:complete len:226 (-),score=87.95 TRINITY_DN18342_c0_g1_i1:66-704(-)
MAEQVVEEEVVEEVVEYVDGATGAPMPAPEDTAFVDGMPAQSSSDELLGETQSVYVPMNPSLEESALSKWEREHADFLVEKAKKSAAEHRRVLDEAQTEVKSFYDERTKGIETRTKQNKMAEEEYRVQQKKLLAGGTVWEQAASLLDFSAKPKQAAAVAAVAAASSPSGSQSPNATAAAAVAKLTENQPEVIDTSRSRQLLIDLKNAKPAAK